MKTARFANVVKQAGRPEVHLLLTDPGKDRSLQRALKSHRVMTVHQARAGSDFGMVGFEKETRGQILVFPKSLKPFAGVRVVGLNYDLLDSAPAAKAKPKSKPESKPAPSEKVVAFPQPESCAEEEETVTALKDGIRQALRALEQGKQVAAFNLLQRLVD